MSNLKKEERPLHRIAYFLRALLREAMPPSLAARPLRRRLTRLAEAPPDPEIAARIAYYNALRPGQPVPERRLAGYHRREGALYYIDLMERARGYGPDTPIDALFGDITEIPPRPMLVKSRPISRENANAVLFPLNKFRHFHFPADPLSWAEKRPMAVWRGRLNHPIRKALVAAYHDDPGLDIGHVTNRDVPGRKGWLTHAEQLRYRYILSIEGNDVATNLKWVMGSNALAIAPPLRFETWYMEGQLKPDIHFLAIKPDLSDLTEKIAWAEAHPDRVAEIIANAQAWTRRFQDPEREADIAALVLQKYLERVGYLPNADWPHRHFAT